MKNVSRTIVMGGSALLQVCVLQGLSGRRHPLSRLISGAGVMRATNVLKVVL